MIYIFIDTDGKAGSGYTKGLPGSNIQFAPQDAWDKVIILSPIEQAKVNAEVNTKAASMKDAIIIPKRTKGIARTISATVDLKDLGAGNPANWGYQVVILGSEDSPANTGLLTRKVNEYEEPHCFSGGNDGDCNPHVIDILAGKGTGTKEEIELQHNMLQYECNSDGSAKSMATLTMVRQ